MSPAELRKYAPNYSVPELVAQYRDLANELTPEQRFGQSAHEKVVRLPPYTNLKRVGMGHG